MPRLAPLFQPLLVQFVILRAWMPPVCRNKGKAEMLKSASSDDIYCGLVFAFKGAWGNDGNGSNKRKKKNSFYIVLL